jgi:hypothetical protein
MADQGTSRREAMQILAYASMAGKFGGLRRWVFACNHDPGEGVNGSDPYQPQFFAPWEYLMIEHLAELIIPNDGTPGAGEAGVSEFIDFMVANSADVGMFRYQPPGYKKPVSEDERIPDAMQSRGDIQSQFRFGLNWLEGHSHRCFKRGFLDCTREQQTEILEHLAYRDRYRDGEEEGRAFFQLMRRYTVMGFYTSRIGLEHLDYKGLVTYWMAMPPCPHKDDPEHLHLPPAVV